MKKMLKRVGSALLSFAVSLQIFVGTTGGISLTAFAASGVEVGPYTITGGSRNIDYKLEGDKLYILTDTPIRIKNTNINAASNIPIIVNADVNADITLAGVNIAPVQYAAIDVSPATQSGANVTITVADDTTNTLKGGDDWGNDDEYDEEYYYAFAGLQKNGGYISENEGKLIIQGESKNNGKLMTYGGVSDDNNRGGAGIGNGYSYGDVASLTTSITRVSNIIITGGDITAVGGPCAAGIGSAWGNTKTGNASSYASYITITGGTVTATGGSSGAGIGTGCGYGTNASYITITGGNVTATGGSFSAGIGSGRSEYVNEASDINILGSTVISTGGRGGAGIGSGSSSHSESRASNITISNSNIVAMSENLDSSKYGTAAYGGAGIGSGCAYTDSRAGYIMITDSNIVATGGAGAAGIGSSKASRGITAFITITDSVVTATSIMVNYVNHNSVYSAGAGIGIGASNTSIELISNIKITNSSVKAVGGAFNNKEYKGAAIGTAASTSADGISFLPTNEAGENLYLVTIPNPNGNPILIDGEEYPITKHADDDSNVYAYLPDGLHAITVDGTTKGCDARTGLVLEIPVVTPPTAKTNLVYNGSNQTLVNAGSTTGGTLVYSLSEDGVYSATIPQGKDAGDYNVWYKVQGDDVYGSTKPQKIAAKIKQVTSMSSAQIAAVTVSPINYGQSLADSTITATASVPGTFAWEDSSIAPTGADSEHTIYNVIFTPTDATNHTSHTIGVKIKVIKLSVPISEPIKQTISASGITYGQQLSNSILTGDVPRPGHYEWKSPTTRPSVSDSNTTKYPVLFVPDDPNYETVELSCSLAVSKKAFTFAYDDIAQLTTGNLVYGQTLSNSAISGPKPVAGTYRWKNGTIKPTVNGTNNYEVEFVPTDTSNYAIVLVGNVHVNVSKADPIITAAQIAGIRTSELTYGQSLSDSTIAAISTTPGTFAWTNGIIVPTVADSNVTDFSITFTPTDTVNYNTKTVSAKVKVNKGTITLSDAIKQSVSASTITYEQTLADSTITGNIPQAGHFEWKNPTTKPSVSDSGVTKYAVVFVPDNPNYLNVDMTLTLIVNKKAVPFTSDMVAQVSASNLIYGQTLADSTLTGDTPISGRYRWLDGSIKPAVNGANKYAVEFVPTDSVNYATVIIGDVHVTVNKADPIMTAEQLAALITSELTYGQTLADSIIMASATTPGTFKWTNEAIVPTVADSMTTSYSITFTPTDTNNYNARILNAKVKVNKAPITLTSVIKQSVVATPITYGQALSASNLSGSTPMAGHYEWKTPTIKPAVSDSNLTQYTVVFVPDDDNYSSAEMTLSLTVNKKAFTFTPSEVSSLSASSLTYGQSLSASTIVGNTPVAGSYRWKNDTIVPTVRGTNSYSVEFVPDDTDNYAIVTVGDVHVTVMKADPVITAEEIAAITTTAITYGQSLSNSTITGTTTLPGSFTWVNGAIMPSVSDSNVTKYDVLFTPDDSDNYNTKTVKTTVKVDKAPVVISDTIKQTISTTGIVYGQTLADSIISGDVPQAGHYEWKDASIAPAVADSNFTRYYAVFVPTDTNYANTELTITVPVSKKAFGLSDFDTNNIVSSSLVYGQTLSESNLIGNTPVAGSYRWADGAIVPTVTNITGYEVEFVPNDTNNYEVVTAGNVRVSVSKANPVITDEQLAAIVATPITYGQTLASSAVTGTASVIGSFAWTDTTIAPSVLDSEFTKYDLTFTPADTDNYNSIIVKSTIKVNKAPVVISDEIKQSITATGITYGDALAASVLSGNVPMSGHYEWKTPAIRPTVADSNTTQFEILFVPDSINYADTELTATLSVSKKAIVFSESDTAGISASGIIYGQSLTDSTLTGVTPVAGSYRWVDSSITPTVNGANNFAVEFVPDDTGNYEIVSAGDVHVTVNKADPVVTQEQMDAVTTSVLIYGQTLGNSTLTGTSTTPGTYGWTNPDIIPSISDSETTLYEVTFTPNDTDNYNTKVFNKTVVVINANIEISDAVLQSIMAEEITYEQTLGDSTITGDVPMPGHYEWANPDIVPTVADSNVTEFDILFVPDNIYYNNVELKLKLSVSKKAYVFTADDIAQILVPNLVYGQTLADVDITGATPVAGSYRWIDNSVAPTVDGTNNFAIEFVPDDTDNYEIVTVGDIHVNVNKADSIITAEQLNAISASEITYGQSLASSIITATASIPGSFDWEDGSIVPTVADSLSTSYTIVFTPTDSINYSAKRINATVKVNKAATILIDAIKQSVSASAITYGESLSDSSISGDTPRDGHYEWMDSSIQPSVADSNATSYDVVFVPDDGNYAVAEMPLKLVVNKKALVFSADELSNISASDLFYGQSLANSVLSGATPVSGSYRWADDSIVPTVNGANDFEVEFVPIDTDNYEIVTAGDIHVTVNAADFVLSSEQLASISASAITYGQSLADSTISASDTIPGVFEWEDGSIAPSVADSLSTEYAVVFTPNDTVNYKQGTHMLKVKVNQAVPEVPDDIETSISIPNLTYGQSLDDLTITYTGSAPFPGHFEWVDPSMSPSVSDSGATEYEIKYVPDDPNYKPIIYKVKVQVDKAPPPQEYDNMSKDIAVPPGANGSIDLSTILDDSWEVVDIQIDDPNRIFDGEPAIIDGKLVFNYNQEKSFVNETGTIKLTIKSPNYEDFDIELNIKATSCKHVNGTTNVGRYASTCTSQGYTGDIVCDTCHCVVKVGRFLPVSAHRCTTKNHTPATCTSEGYSGDEYCKDCGELVSSGHILEMTEHTEGEPVTVVEPTYAAEGKYDYYCIDCNAFIRSSVIPKLSLEGHEHVWESGYGHDEHDHWKECTECHNSFDKEAHHYDDGTYITATCTTEGRVEYTCGVCGLTVLRIEVPGHKPVWKYDENGDRHFKQCKECGKVFETENHNYGQWIEVVTPTDTELGTYVHTCNECGYIETVHSATNPEVGSDIGGSEGGNGGNSTGGNSSDPTGGSGSNSGNNASSIGDNGTNTGKGENPDTGIEFDVIKFVALALVSAATILLSRKCKI